MTPGLVGIAYELDDPGGVVWQLLGLLDSSRSRDEVVADLQRERPGLDAGTAHELIDVLVVNGSVEDAAAEPPPVFSSARAGSLQPQYRLLLVGRSSPPPSPYHHQLRLKESSVTVLGLGGTGASVALSLVGTCSATRWPTCASGPGRRSG